MEVDLLGPQCIVLLFLLCPYYVELVKLVSIVVLILFSISTVSVNTI